MPRRLWALRHHYHSYCLTARPHPPPSPLHQAPSHGCIAQEQSCHDRGWRMICARADAPWRRRAPYCAPCTPTRRPTWWSSLRGTGVRRGQGRGGSSSGSGACAGRPRSAHRTFSRGHTQADRAVQVWGLGATPPAPSEGWQALRARHRDRAQCVLSSPTEEGCPRLGAEWRRTHRRRSRASG